MSLNWSFELPKSEAKQRIAELVARYEQVKKSGSIKKYNEAETCKEFILPLFNALGWDTNAKAEVSAEEHTNAKDRADYGFYLNGWPKFYLEAKKLGADLHDEKFAKQAIAYSWNKGIAWAVLTDFESLIVFNSQDIAEHLSHKLVFEIKYDQYLDRFDQFSLLSKEAFTNNSLDEYGEKHGKKLQRVSVTDTLYKDLNASRLLLLKSFRAWKKEVPGDLLEEGVQKLLDRLIFIRVAEDRQLEPPTLIPMLRASGGSATEKFYQSLVTKFRELDKIYNSDLFAPHPLEGWQEYDGATEKVIEILHGKTGYYEYNFQAIPADVLGSVYENYLGYQLAQSDKGIEVSKNARKRKEQGIYYTPTYIVDYIVTNALKPVLDKCESVQDLKAIKVLDPACGSGSFLIRAVEMIYQKYLEFGATPGEMTKITILLDNIYGVDLDEQAVEIARLNLLISALDSRMPLPDLSNNIKNGNSLISGTDAELEKAFGKNYRDKKPFNWQQEFPEVFERENPGFDVIIGNPPWISYYSRQSQKLDEPERQYYLNEYRTFSKGNSRINTIMLFLEKGIDTLRQDGLLGFVLDKQIQDVDAYKETRVLLTSETSLKNIVLSVPFPEINLDTCVVIAEKSENAARATNNIRMFDLLSITGQLSTEQVVEQAQIAGDKEAIFKLQKKNPLLKKLLQKSCRLDDVARVTTGMCITADDFCSDTLKDKSWHKGVFGTNVSRYSIIWPSAEQLPPNSRRGIYICFSKELEKQVNARFARQGSKTIKAIGDESRFQQPKIFVRQGPGEVELIAALDSSDIFYAHQTLHIINQKNNKYSLGFLLGYINSSFATYLARELGIIIHGEKKRPQIRTRALAKLPVPVDLDHADSEQIENRVQKMVDLKLEFSKEDEGSNRWNSIKSEIEETDHQIDQLVYKLYNLTPEEIRLVEESTQK